MEDKKTAVFGIYPSVSQAERAVDALVQARFPADAPPLYGDGHASERIAQVLVATIPSR